VYRVVPDTETSEQIAALPVTALPALMEALEVLSLAPQSAGRPYNADKPDGGMRELFFGPEGAGSITYLLLEHQREVHLLVVQWLDLTGDLS
jgi:hypothetical protein